MTVPEEFITQVEAERKRQGLTQTELAKKAGLDQSDISRVLSASRKNVNTETLQKIAKGLGKTLEILLK